MKQQTQNKTGDRIVAVRNRIIDDIMVRMMEKEEASAYEVMLAIYSLAGSYVRQGFLSIDHAVDLLKSMSVEPAKGETI